MPLKVTSIRFAADGLGLIQEAAERVGCTVSQFTREAALMRAMIVLRDEHSMTALDEELRREEARRVRRLARRNDPGEDSGSDPKGGRASGTR